MNKVLLTILLSVVTLPTFAQNMRTDLEKHFKNFNLVKFDKAEILEKSKIGELVRVAGFEFSISPRDLFVGLDEVKTFRGKLSGNPDSEVRLSFNENSVRGYIFDGETRFYIESAAKFSNKASKKDHIFYKSEDRKNEEPALSLADDVLQTGLAMTSPKIVDVLTSGLKTTRVIEIATDADYQWVTEAGGATQANEEILSIINMAEGVYERQLGLTFSVTFQHAWITPDPYSMRNQLDVSLDFKNYWNANFSHVDRDAAHLFSGKSFVRGNAFPGEICVTPYKAYAITGRNDFSRTWKTFAHEVGHNLGAAHINNSEDCELTIMNSDIYPLTSERFCQTSIDQIISFVNKNGSCLQQIKTKFDFDGDRKTDYAIFRPSVGEWWYLRSGDGGNRAFQFGLSSDKPVPADYTGDGKTDIAFYRPSTGEWFVLRSEDSSFYSAPFGTNGDIAVPADYDGDGKADLAVFRPSEANWYINRSSGGFSILQFGADGDVPVPGGYDGDNKADLAIYRPAVGEWWFLRSSDGGNRAFQFGNSTDKPIPADYTGDGKTDIAFFRPATGEWFVLRSEDSSFYSAPFGAIGDVPIPGDYDGDGKADFAVWRESDRNWYIAKSTGGFSIAPFGSAGDKPVPSAFVP